MVSQTDAKNVGKLSGSIINLATVIIIQFFIKKHTSLSAVFVKRVVMEI